MKPWLMLHHQYKESVTGGCVECNDDYWVHKWNPNTLHIHRTALIMGLMFGLVIGAAIACLVLVILLKGTYGG